jgi:putative cell wall-binding protein
VHSERDIAPRRGGAGAILSTAAAVAMVLAALFPAAATPAMGASEPFRAPAETRTIEVGDPSLADEPQLSIEGTIRVIEVDAGAQSRTEYSVATESGLVRISGDLDEVPSGSTFSGTVAIPTVIVDGLTEAQASRVEGSAEDPIAPYSVEGMRVMSSVASEAVEMPVVAAQASYQVQEAGVPTSPTAHTVDVAVINSAPVSDSDVNALVAGLNDFWSSQSNGIVASVSRPSAIQRYNSPFLASCNFDAMWREGALKFGAPPTADPAWSRYGTTEGRHLVVIAYQLSPNCGVGIGSIGGQFNMGGVTWINAYGDIDLHTLAHEFGHNLGLGHANVRICADPIVVEADSGCQDRPYEDYYDVMAGGFTWGTHTTNKLGALNVTDKVKLGYYPAGSLVSVGSSTTVTLKPASDTAGVRGLKVTDPLNPSDVYYVEYRSGTGMDSGTFYTYPPTSEYGLRPGLRVLRLVGNASQPGNASVALAQLQEPGDPRKMLALKEGSSFTSRYGGITIRYASTAAGVSVQVDLGVHGLPATIDRISGESRYSTAVAVARAAYPTGAPVVYVAQGANYPDALGAAPAAVAEGGPLLLTETMHLTAIVRDAIDDLDPEKIVVAGGTGAVSAAVFDELKAMVPNTIRVGGVDRYETARLLVEQAFDTAPFAFVATGSDFPDALSASAAAGAVGAPVILVPGLLSTIDVATKELIQSLGVANTRIVGGTGVVSQGIQNALATITSVSRAAGIDRFATNHLVNSAIFTSVPWAFVATGYQFPDALAGAAMAGAKGAPLYLVTTTCIPQVIRADIVSGDTTRVTLIGGTGVLAPSVQAFARC